MIELTYIYKFIRVCGSVSLLSVTYTNLPSTDGD